MKHDEPGFYKFICAYVMIGAGTLLVLDELLEFAFFEKKFNLTGGVIAIWLGVLFLTGQVRKRKAASSDKDKTKD